MEYYIHTLDNGIRLVHQAVNSPVAHCGIIINTGSRDEREDQQGMAHFIEHLIFKGTEKRRAHHILSRMEDVGGEINAYTTKEETCVYTTFFNNYHARAFELISDIVFNSTFPEKEVQKEKEVIIDEINSYKDSPLEQIYDDFEEHIFHSNQICHNILGTKKSLKSHTQKKLKDFYRQNYTTSEMVVSSVGSLPFKTIVGYFKKYFDHIEYSKRISERIPFKRNSYKPGTINESRNTYQAHCILGNLAYSNREEKRFTLHLLNNLLGGPGMNSRLNMNLREKNGLAYNVESNYNTYSDIGLINIYFGTDKKDLNRCIDLTHRELNKLNSAQLGAMQLARAKRQLIGQIAISSENFENLMLANGRSLLLFDKIDSLKEITEKINAISSKEIMEVSNEIFDLNKFSYLIYT